MKKIKLFLVIFYGVCQAQLNVEQTNFEKIAVGGRAEFTKWNITEQRPLMIVNGIEIANKSGAFVKIDPNDIDKIDILKDEKAIEKYGYRAIDGAILVTLKKDTFRKYRRLLKSNSNSDKTTSEVIFDKNKYNIILNGVVKDEYNLGIAKALVTNLTKKETYYTDSLGNYKINIAKNDLINFSKKGFESQKIRIQKDTIVNITLKNQTTPDVIMVKKPVIYLYPKEKTDISIKIDFKGKILTTFPKYEQNWNLIGYPDGQIFDKKTNRFYSSLFWDGTQTFPKEHYNYQSGFVVSKND